MLGISANILVTVMSFVFQSIVPQELLELNNKITITPIARLCYGGFTEELLMRFGLMTFIVWITSKITGNLKHATYCTGIIISYILPCSHNYWHTYFSSLMTSIAFSKSSSRLSRIL
ncbi:MAG: hypothetical protein LBS69_02480 [Prevotellaceae bacterium]|nr:hypothetical protein [Prevotellaceae bacterium]